MPQNVILDPIWWYGRHLEMNWSWASDGFSSWLDEGPSTWAGVDFSGDRWLKSGRQTVQVWDKWEDRHPDSAKLLALKLENVHFLKYVVFPEYDRPPWWHVSFMSWRVPCMCSRSHEWFFLRASDRRVLLIVGVCYTSSHIHIFIFTSTQIILKSSHLHIFIFTSTQIILKSSHFHILTSAHLHTSSHIFTHLLLLALFFTSSHRHIFTSSHFLSLSLALLPSVTVSLLLLLFSLWQCRRGAMRFNRQKLK